MNKNALLLLILFFGSQFISFSQVLKTSGGESPAVIAQNFSAVYGVRVDAVMAILKIYEKEGLTPDDRKRSTETLLKKYSQAPEKKQFTAQLSKDSKTKLGLINTPALSDALDWDLFARKNYLSTSGTNSPAVVANGDVNIWYGIPPIALRSLAQQLEDGKSEFEKRLKEQVVKYEKLKAEFEAYGPTDPTVKKAEQLLAQGNLLELEKLIDSDYSASKKRQAYKGYLYGKTKELRLKYDTAAIGYRDAVFLDPNNSKYLRAYAFNENICSHYDTAIIFYEKALAIDTIINKDKRETIAVLYNNLGSAWSNKGNYERAIQFYWKALAIDSVFFGRNHTSVARDFSNLGVAVDDKGDHYAAMKFYEQALIIDSIVSGQNHPDVARDLNNIGVVLSKTKSDYDLAIHYFERALSIYIKDSDFGEKHPNVAAQYNNIGAAWDSKGDYDRAIQFYNKALAIDSVVYGQNHPEVARVFNNIGSAFQNSDKYDLAIKFYNKAIAIDSIVYGQYHQRVAIDFNNIGSLWHSRGEYDRSFQYYKKAFNIDSIVFGLNNPAIARDLNNIGSHWKAEGNYERAIEYYEKALVIDSTFFGQNHLEVARKLNNIGEAWLHTAHPERAIYFFERALPILVYQLGDKHPYVAIEYNNIGGAYLDNDPEKAIKNIEQALVIDSVTIGTKHPDIAIRYNNLGKAWLNKGVPDKAIIFFENALSIDTIVLGKNHPDVALLFNNLGSAYYAKKEFDHAIYYYENCNAVLKGFPITDGQNVTYKNIALAANDRGIELMDEKRYVEAVTYFKKGLENAEAAEYWPFSVTCLNNIGSSQKRINHFDEGFIALEKGIVRAQELAKQFLDLEKTFPPETLNHPNYPAWKEEQLQKAVLRRMYYHEIGCLIGLGRKKEAKSLIKKLRQESIISKDSRTLEDLKKDGYIKN